VRGHSVETNYRLGDPGFAQLGRVDAVPAHGWFFAECAIDDKCLIPIARNLTNSISADTASVQMIVDLQLSIQIQLLVDQLQKTIKTACAHNTLLLTHHNRISETLYASVSANGTSGK
jgi:hypothetical protein